MVSGNALLVPLLVLWFHSNPLTPQQLIYEVYRGKSPIGEMEVNRYQEGLYQIYESDSRMTVQFLMAFDLRFTYESRFKDGNLHFSETVNQRDGKIMDSSKGERIGEKFHTNVDGKEESVHAPHIDYTVVSSYFFEPVGKEKVFSERWGNFIPIKPAGEHRYAMHLPNGDINYLTYKNGICDKIEVNHILGSIKFVLKNRK